MDLESKNELFKDSKSTISLMEWLQWWAVTFLFFPGSILITFIIHLANYYFFAENTFPFKIISFIVAFGGIFSGIVVPIIVLLRMWDMWKRYRDSIVHSTQSK